MRMKYYFHNTRFEGVVAGNGNGGSSRDSGSPSRIESRGWGGGRYELVVGTRTGIVERTDSWITGRRIGRQERPTGKNRWSLRWQISKGRVAFYYHELVWLWRGPSTSIHWIFPDSSSPDCVVRVPPTEPDDREMYTLVVPCFLAGTIPDPRFRPSSRPIRKHGYYSREASLAIGGEILDDLGLGSSGLCHGLWEALSTGQRREASQWGCHWFPSKLTPTLKQNW
jgi:hypothetical protein